jgi:hypothetical protein
MWKWAMAHTTSEIKNNKNFGNGTLNRCRTFLELQIKTNPETGRRNLCTNSLWRNNVRQKISLAMTSSTSNNSVI